MKKFVNYIEFYEETLRGGYGSEPRCYKLEGETLNEVKHVDDIIWKAIEIDGFDNRRVLVKMRIEEEGNAVCNDKFYVDNKVVRTDAPSKFIKQEGDRHIFEINKAMSSIEIKDYMTTKPNWMKHCPFCNGEIQIAHTSHLDLKHRSHFYVCKSCDASMFLKASGKYRSQEATEAEAMNLWNDSLFLLPDSGS